MKKTLRSTLLALAVCVGACTLTSCTVNPRHVTVASAAGLSPADVAVLSVIAGDKTKGLEGALIIHVHDTSRRDLINPDGGSRATHSVTVPPGLYQLTLSVSGGYRETNAYPRMLVRVEAGKRYNVAAVRVMDGRAVRAVYREASAGAVHE